MMCIKVNLNEGKVCKLLYLSICTQIFTLLFHLTLFFYLTPFYLTLLYLTLLGGAIHSAEAPRSIQSSLCTCLVSYSE